MEQEPKSGVTISRLSIENVDAADDMRRQSWLDTYDLFDGKIPEVKMIRRASHEV